MIVDFSRWSPVSTVCPTLFVVLASTGCAPLPATSTTYDAVSDTGEPRAQLEPLAPSSMEGAVFGRIQVLNDGSPIKSGCTAHFTSESGSEKAVLSLDESGWVFTTIRRGLTYLSGVTCTVGVATPSYESRAHVFEVPGHGKIVYFGELRIDMHTNPYVRTEPSDWNQTASDLGKAEDVIGGVPVVGGTVSVLLGLAAILAATERKAPSGATADVYDHFTGAKFTYETRYGGGAGALRPVAAIAGEPINASKFAPRTVAGFALGDDIAKAEKLCTAAGHTWQKLDAKKYPKYSCSGPGATLGVPVTVELGTCADVVCKIALNGNPDGVPWETIVPRFVGLAKPLIQVSGKPHDRTVQPLKDCKTTMEVEKCFAAGRVRLSLMWEWADARTASLIMDGGAAGKTPTLSLVYRAN